MPSSSLRKSCLAHHDPPCFFEERGTNAGARSAVYGTMLAVAGVGLAGTLLARSLGIHNAADLQERMQTMWAPVGHHAQLHIVPWRIWLQVLLLSQPSHVFN